MKLESALFIVATPIGNLGDMTSRAVDILKHCDVIAAEDTRHSGRLLQHFDINTRMMTYHDHSSAEQVEKFLKRLEKGESVALISDAGTPLISDPGYRLVQQARENGFKVISIPGACALIAALSVSGLPSDKFIFDGFSAAKSSARRSTYESLKHETRTCIFYESPHRILDALEDMRDVFDDEREIVLAREITKTFETVLSGSVSEVLSRVREDKNQQKGEMVILLRGYVKPEEEGISLESQRVMNILLDELPVKQAAALASKITDTKKNRLYQWAISAEG